MGHGESKQSYDYHLARDKFKECKCERDLGVKFVLRLSQDHRLVLILPLSI